MNKKVLGLSVLSSFLVLGFVISPSVFAAQFGSSSDRPNFDPARFAEMQVNREAMETALTNGDYNAWLVLQPVGSPMRDVITQDNFLRLVEAHRLMSEAHSIMSELGLLDHGPKMGGPGDHFPGHGFKKGIDQTEASQ